MRHLLHRALLVVAVLSGCDIPGRVVQERQATTAGHGGVAAGGAPASGGLPAGGMASGGMAAGTGGKPEVNECHPPAAAEATCDHTQPFGEPRLVQPFARSYFPYFEYGLWTLPWSDPSYDTTRPNYYGDLRLSLDERGAYFLGAGAESELSLWQCARLGVDENFGACQAIADLDRDPASGRSCTLGYAVSADGLTLFFAAGEFDGAGCDVRLFRANRADTSDSFGESNALPLDDGSHPVLSDDGQRLYVMASTGAIVQVKQPEDPSAQASTVFVADIDWQSDVFALSHDELTLYFSTRESGDDSDVWVAERSSIDEPFERPQSVAGIQSSGDDQPAWLSADGCRLYLYQDGLTKLAEKPILCDGSVYTAWDADHCGACCHACGGSECSDGLCEPIEVLSGLSGPRNLVVSDGRAYFGGTGVSSVDLATVAIPQQLATDHCVGFVAVDEEYVFFTSGSTINSVPKAGGAATNVVTSDVPGAQTYILGLALDETFLYWSENVGTDANGYQQRLLRAPKTGSFGTVIASHQVAGGLPADLAVDATDLYWITDTAVMTMPKAGGMARQLAPAFRGTALALDADNVFWTQAGAVARIAKAGGATQILAGDRGPDAAQGLVIDERFVYWSTYSGLVMRVLKSGGGLTTLAHGQTPNNTTKPVWVVSVDATYLYWLEGIIPGSATCWPYGQVLYKVAK